MWALAALDGAAPVRPNQVPFPVTKNMAERTARLKRPKSVPCDYLARIRLLEAWVDGIEPEQSMLGLLSQVDTIDKHRGLIAGAVNVVLVRMSHLPPGGKASIAMPTAYLRSPSLVLSPANGQITEGV